MSIGIRMAAAAWLCRAACAASLTFPIGETARYCFYWNGIPVGEAKVRVLAKAGAQQLRLHVSGGTNSVIDKLYRLRISGASLVNLPDLTPVRYTLVQKERKRQYNYVLTYDPKKGSFKSVKTYVHKPGKQKVYTIKSSSAFDILGGVYALRLRPLKPGGASQVDIAMGKGLYHVTLKIGQPKSIRIDLGRIKTLPVTVKIVRVQPPEDKKRPTAKAWVTNDARRLPLRMSAGTRWGTISAELKEVQPPLVLPKPRKK